MLAAARAHSEGAGGKPSTEVRVTCVADPRWVGEERVEGLADQCR